MKKFLLSFMMMVALTMSAFAIVVDVKTAAQEKGRLAGFEIGIMYYLNYNNINVFDVGEDYAVWITLVSEQRVGNKREYIFNIEVTRPSALFKKKEILAKTQNIKIVLQAVQGSAVNTADETMMQLARKKAVDLKDQTLIECQVGGKILADYIIQLLAKIKS